MSDTDITVVVSGAPLTGRTPDLVAALGAEGWRPTVVATPAAAAWLDADAVAAVTGEAPRFEFRSPEQAKRGGPPSAVVVCPATFNTINKAATGAADTYALAVVCEALGTGLPMLLVPMVNNKLWGHPAWAGNLMLLRNAGAVLVDIHTGLLEPAAVASGTGGEVVERFEPAWVTAQLKRLLSR
ncbi:flavoprotein [Phytohabitans sp. ZYX-F-186]|uniref:Flavoprotein n=1 Tax=Phytohabitans maris TaxID=3071409 RepID=A0ABU0ZX08_9ACTN|nr:flavoprotein [Phytohabitans sp. ZYX-F-186]MDQ7910745.1 flavoprotein [Phytohabitans sp. ZYX-F-186]